MKRFSVTVQDCNKHSYFTILKVSQYDILKSGKNQLVVALLKGSDGKEDHCVTVFDNWVFDSNFDWALPFSKEALDHCCSSEETQEYLCQCMMQGCAGMVMC